MNCMGIYVDAYTTNKIFNVELAVSQGKAIVSHNFIEDPERMRQLVEQRLKRTNPHINVQFLDFDSEQEVSLEQIKEIGSYSLLICGNAPILSGGKH